MRNEVLVRQVFAWTLLLVGLVGSRSALAQPTVLDGFESPEGWKVITAEGVTLSVKAEEGVKGKCLRLDYDFVSGAGYCIIQKAAALKLPANYEFTFQLRGEGPANNLEFKLLDASGESVWWHNRRALEWPRAWTRMIDKKRSLEFAWGPSGGAPLTETSKIEFAIASSSGGKGSVWLDELTFRELPPESHEAIKPTATASASAAEFGAEKTLDGDLKTAWRSGLLTQEDHPTFTLDLGRVAEVGGVDINWESAAASLYVESSDDAKTWTRLTGDHQPRADTMIVPTPEAEARYLRLVMIPAAAGNAVAIREIRVRPPEFSESANAMFTQLAAESPLGRYPRCFSNKQSYWTVVGVDGDDAEALVNEEGAVELCKRGPTLEPFITVEGTTFSWADGKHTASLERGCLPMPSVDLALKSRPLSLTVTAFADGPPGASLLWITYRLQSLIPTDDAPAIRGRLHVALRPFQVNPPWQKLNNEGGFAPLTAVDPSDIDGHAALTFNHAYSVVALNGPARAGVATFESGDVSEWLASGRPTLRGPVEDPDGRASGEITFDFEVQGRAERNYTLVFAMHGTKPAQGLTDASVDGRREACARAWDEKVSRVTITVPKKDQWIADTFKSQIAYILINRDGPAIQPGSRSYERSWARDGSMTSAALLACGHPEEVKAWIDWFGAHQFESGKIPCVVDKRGADPVPEHDSSGEYIWAVANYYRFTHDKAFLKSHWKRVQKAVAYMQSLRAERMTPEFAAADSPSHAFYGLVPESISHEGYSAKPMHSYWDDFFVLLGLKEAAWLASEVGAADETKKYTDLAADFRKCLYDSMRLAMAEKKIDYIPGCVELGDFDSTSTTIALFPCDEGDQAPQPALKRTFDRYWDFFQARRSSLSAWDAYTPYEIRHVGAFVRLGEPQRAYEALSWFHLHQRPQAWNHWAEVVWSDPLTPKFIGDMPHTWVGSDYLNSVCSMFVYEHAGQVVTFAGAPRAWVDSGEIVGFNDIVTSRGKISGSLQLKDGRVRVKLWATGTWGEGDIVIKKPPGTKGQDAVVRALPAQVSFEYAQ